MARCPPSHFHLPTLSVLFIFLPNRVEVPGCARCVHRQAEDRSDDVRSACPEYPWNDIKGFRNFVAHGYREVDRSVAWKVIADDLPALELRKGNLTTGLQPVKFRQMSRIAPARGEKSPMVTAAEG